MRDRAKSRVGAAVAAAALSASALAAFGVLAGACGSPFNSDGYVADGGSHDATTPPGGDDGGAETGAGSVDAAPDAPLGILHDDGIRDNGCVPKTCAEMGIDCNPHDDGCGRLLDCGVCHHYGDTCSAAGTCGCVPLTSTDANCAGKCGDVPDGCGSFFACPDCGTGLFCGRDNTCSGTACTPIGNMSNDCGTVSDGCGSTRYDNDGNQCPTNNANNGCNLGPTPYKCDCFPSSCGQQGWACGQQMYDNRCGGMETCGGCIDPPGQCNSGRTCDTCTRVAAPEFAFDGQCGNTAHPYAWACDCADGGVCVKPDGLTEDDPRCAQLTSTADHTIYCCDEPK